MNRKPSQLVVLTGVVLLLGALLAPSVTGNEDAPCPAGKFPASGQTTAHQADINDGISGNFVDVPDDGTLEAGATLRYRDNGDGTITDLDTKLTWEKKSSDGGLHDVDNGYPWSGGGQTIWDWLKDINTENGVGFADHHDWRIPNAKELQSIVDYERFMPSVAPAFNNNCTGNTVLTGSCSSIFGYWTSTSEASSFQPSNLRQVWVVFFGDGFVATAPRDAEFSAFRVRAVRGGCVSRRE
jgi:hypothetical protein